MRWLLGLMRGLNTQFVLRFKKHHATGDIIPELMTCHSYFPVAEFKEPPKVMPEDCIDPNSTIQSYRTYYKLKSFATWNKGVSAPAWWTGS